MREAVKKQAEYLNNQGVNKPVETPPEGFREWEPGIKEILDKHEQMKRETDEYFKEKYEVVAEIGPDGEVKVLEGELPKPPEVPQPKKVDGQNGENE
jgi:hypothetical protein